MGLDERLDKLASDFTDAMTNEELSEVGRAFGEVLGLARQNERLTKALEDRIEHLADLLADSDRRLARLVNDLRPKPPEP